MEDPIAALKRQLGAEIATLMHGASRTQLYLRLLVDGPRISELRRQKLDRFSLESLIRFVHRLDRAVELTVVDPRLKRLERRALRGSVARARGNSDIGL